jgi:hypothetical protein
MCRLRHQRDQKVMKVYELEAKGNGRNQEIMKRILEMHEMVGSQPNPHFELEINRLHFEIKKNVEAVAEECRHLLFEIEEINKLIPTTKCEAFQIKNV